MDNVEETVASHVRSVFCSSSPGHVLVSGDYDQLELRIVACRAQDKAMLRAFIEHRDIHDETTEGMFSIKKKAMSPEVWDNYRKKGKTCNFGVVYGLSIPGIMKKFRMTEEEATDIYNRFFKAYPGIKQYTEDIEEELAKTGYVATWMGYRRRLPGIFSYSEIDKQKAIRQAMNYPIQTDASALIGLHVLPEIFHFIKEEGLKTEIIMQIYDQIILNVPIKELEVVVPTLKQIMEHPKNLPFKPAVPLTSNIEIGRYWNEMQEVTI